MALSKQHMRQCLPLLPALYKYGRYGELRDVASIQQSVSQSVSLSVCLCVPCPQLNDGAFFGYGYYRTSIGNRVLEV